MSLQNLRRIKPPNIPPIPIKSKQIISGAIFFNGAGREFQNLAHGLEAHRSVSELYPLSII